MLVSPAVSTSSSIPARDAGALIRSLYIRTLLGSDTAGLHYVQSRILESSKKVRDGGLVGRYNNELVTEEVGASDLT